MSAPAAPPVTLSRLLPPGGPVTAREVVADLALGDRAAGGRPYLILNMVATADGKATLEGRTAPMSGVADRQLFHQLRTCADAVMVGAGTVRVERYGRLVRDPALREQRRERGLQADPVAIVVSRTLSVPADVPLLQDPDSRVLIVTESDAELEGCAADVRYLRPPAGERLDLGAILARLGDEHGLRSVLCEGGPGLNASLLPAGLVDELFLSVAPLLAGGGDALTIVSGAALRPAVDLDLVWLLESEGHLLARYAVRTPARPG